MSEKQPIPSDDPPSYTPSAIPQKPSLPRPPPLELPALLLLRSKRVILASASPRRKQLLSQIGLCQPHCALEIIPSNFAENLPKDGLSAFEYVLATATSKALSVYEAEVTNPELGEPGLIIAADTVVVSSGGEILEKPKSEAQHIAMLKGLRDTGPHRVYTAVVCVTPLESARDPGYAMERAWEETVVKFDETLTDELILAYVRTREGVDKAGGYGIQGTGAILVERIEGSFDNVVGLPLRLTLKLIEKVMAKADDDDVLTSEILEGADDEADGHDDDEPEDWLSGRIR